jgi:thiamine-monophosphate kinase
MLTGTQFELIDRILERLGDRVAETIIVPPGDDAAVWRTQGTLAVGHTDTLIEGVHWIPTTMSFCDVGWRVVAVNVSDIAAMGATPRYIFLTVLTSPSLVASELDALIDGVAESCRFHDVMVVGGGVDASPMNAVSVTVFGEVTDIQPPPVMRRDAARIGHVVAVSGRLGASAAGLELIRTGREGDERFASLLGAHRRPIARVQLGRSAATAGVRAAIDISDGLVQDLGHIARRSEVGIDIDIARLPLDRAAIQLLGRHRAVDLALGGGEDYELALIADFERLSALASDALPVTIIGRVVSTHRGDVHVIDPDGRRYTPPVAGWDHVRSVQHDSA